MSSRGVIKTIKILLVEDNPGDIRLTQEVFREGKVHSDLSVVTDGVEALAFLQQKGKYVNAPRPNLILLDLNLPKKNGCEVLMEIKADPDLKSIPVVILTTSNASQDILKTYNLHANCYIKKPVDLEQFFTVIRSIENFWLTIVTLPPDE